MEKKYSLKQSALIAAIICAALCGASFWGGLAVGKSQSPSLGQRGNFNGMSGTGPAGSKRAAGASFVSGDIISVDNSSLTLKLANGGSKIVIFGSSTEIGKFTAASASDLSANQSVMANGTANADGSLTAKSIQIRPAGSPQPPQPQNR